MGVLLCILVVGDIGAPRIWAEEFPDGPLTCWDFLVHFGSFFYGSISTVVRAFRFAAVVDPSMYMDGPMVFVHHFDVCMVVQAEKVDTES